MDPRIWTSVVTAFLFLLSFQPAASYAADQSALAKAVEVRFIQVVAKNKQERSAIANSGMSIEFVRSDSVWGFASGNSIEKLKHEHFKILGNFPRAVGRGGHHGVETPEATGDKDFPPADARYHNFAETTAQLRSMVSAHADIAKLISIGKSVEGRDIWALHINSTPEALIESVSQKPGMVYMGAHHAREHLSTEVPLMFADYLLKNLADPKIANLVDTRDVWIIPVVNPDGAEYDISTGHYKLWRKNRRDNHDGTFGVDLNRNYSFGWGTGGSSADTSDETYKGTAAFSEPESSAIRDFIDSHLNTKILLTFHTYSELILYPWGGKNDPVPVVRDRETFQKMATTMAGWNHYTPEQASDLYIASGDTCDWAYGTHGIFAFTFEMSPKNTFGGAGFYPGAAMVDRAFADNLQPMLYMLDLADDPYRALTTQPTDFLHSYVQPQLAVDRMWDPSARL